MAGFYGRGDNFDKINDIADIDKRTAAGTVKEFKTPFFRRTKAEKIESINKWIALRLICLSRKINKPIFSRIALAFCPYILDPAPKCNYGVWRHPDAATGELANKFNFTDGNYLGSGKTAKEEATKFLEDPEKWRMESQKVRKKDNGII